MVDSRQIMQHLSALSLQTELPQPSAEVGKTLGIHYCNGIKQNVKTLAGRLKGITLKRKITNPCLLLQKSLVTRRLNSPVDK